MFFSLGDGLGFEQRHKYCGAVEAAGTGGVDATHGKGLFIHIAIRRVDRQIENVAGLEAEFISQRLPKPTPLLSSAVRNYRLTSLLIRIIGRGGRIDADHPDTRRFVTRYCNATGKQARPSHTTCGSAAIFAQPDRDFRPGLPTSGWSCF